jgi:hypothetical protein
MLVIKIGIKETLIDNGHNYQVQSVVLGELKPTKLV